MLTGELTDQEFQIHALSILQRELGAEGFERFVQVLKGVAIDEVAERVRTREADDEPSQ